MSEYQCEACQKSYKMSYKWLHKRTKKHKNNVKEEKEEEKHNESEKDVFIPQVVDSITINFSSGKKAKILVC